MNIMNKKIIIIIIGVILALIIIADIIIGIYAFMPQDKEKSAASPNPSPDISATPNISPESVNPFKNAKVNPFD
jgi:flagellar basal body-associated protein FliL